MKHDCRSYSSISKTSPKIDGKFGVAFGEFPRLSTLTLTYNDGSKYDFTSIGNMRRSRRNDMGDVKTDIAIARDAARLAKSGNFVRGAIKDLADRKHNISAKDVSVFGKNIERFYHIREDDSLTGKLMGGA